MLIVGHTGPIDYGKKHAFFCGADMEQLGTFLRWLLVFWCALVFARDETWLLVIVYWLVKYRPWKGRS